MLRNMLGLMVIVLALSASARADTLKVMAAGSLRAAVTDLLHRFPLQSDTVEPPEFGPSGLMRRKIENGATVDVFASADMQQPRQLAAGHPERMVIHFARNGLCVLSRPNLDLNEDTFSSGCSIPRCELRRRRPVPIRSEPTAGKCSRGRMRSSPVRARRWKRRQNNWSAAERKHPLSCREREPSKAYSCPTRRTLC
jgi:hypothetical protein